MKKITAIVRPCKLEELKEELLKINLNGITISQVMGCGTQLGWTEFYRGAEISLNILPKVKLELVVEDGQVDTVSELIVKYSRTGEVGDIGDGKIFISDITDCIRIRTGERGILAL